MRRFSSIAFASAILAIAGSAHAASPLPAALNVLGSVTNAARPVANALVIALNLNNLEASQTFTGPDGSFTLPLLPAGVYKVIAMKYGFTPASATVVPNRKDQRLALRLQSEKRGARSANQEIWEIRGSLPPDVLHEIDIAMAPPMEIAVNAMEDAPRLRAQMSSMTGVAQTATASPTFAQSSLGVQSRISDDWQIGFQGNLHRIENPIDEERFGEPMAESKAMNVEVRSSPTDSYRLASSKSFWRYRNDVPVAQRQADVRSHNFEWKHGDARFAVRYFQQENLFAANPASELIEVAGNTTVLQTARTDLGVAVRVTQESVRSNAATFRTADVTTTGKLEVVPSFSVRYGMTSRLGLYGTEWAPRTGVEWSVGKNTALVFSGLHKVYDQERQNMMPSVVVWTDESSVLPRYSYSFGIVSGPDQNDRISAIMTISAADSPLRVVFTDGFEQFWDGLYVDTGDIRRDLRVTYRKELGDKFAFDISSSAGTATPPPTALIRGEKVYVTGDVASTFNPTGTTVAVSYRQLHQPVANGNATEYRSERMNVRVAQSLHLPFDLRLLVGMELAHATNSPFLFDAFAAEGQARKYIGGLAVNF